MFLKGIYFERYEILKNLIKFFVISCKIYMYMYKGDVNFCVIYKVF